MENANSCRTEPQTWWQLAKSCSGTRFDRRNYFVFIAWLIAWAVIFQAATRLLQRDLFQTTPAFWMLVILPTAIGIIAPLAYLRFLRFSDGLLRQVQLDGLAVGFGAGVVFALGYRVFEYAGAPELRVPHVVAIMLIGWSAGQLLSLVRHR